jgi:ubiquinone/menaquinone biosynthesis C-methylase UbiE
LKIRSKNIQAFDELASHYEETVDEELRRFWGWNYQDFVVQLVRSILDNGAPTILDVATGTGLIPREISSRLQCGAKIVGLDLTFAALKQAQQKTGPALQPASIDYINATAQAMPFAPGSFDCVVCALAAHHIGRAAFLQQAFRALKEGGQLILADVAASPYWKLPGIALLLRLAAFLYFLFKENPARAWTESEAVSNVYTVDEWVAAISQVGFSGIVSTRPQVQRFWAPPAMIITARKPVSGDIR